MIKIQDKQTGKTEEVDDSALPDIVSSGNYLVPNKDYVFEDEDGQKRAVKGDKLAKAISLGYRYVPEAEIKQEEINKKYGSGIYPALAATAATLRGGTLGLSDIAYTGLGGEPETLQNLKTANPGISTGFEVAGALLPIALSGGAATPAAAGKIGLSAIAKKAPSALVQSLASEAGKKLAGKASSEVAKKIIQYSAEGAIEGTLGSIGIQLSEDAIGDKDFNAESLLAAAGTGAVLGGGAGALLGVGANALNKAVGKTKGAVDQYKKKVLEGLDKTQQAELLAKNELEDKALKMLAKPNETMEQVRAKIKEREIGRAHV
jgi:hypothetical protein